MNLARLSHAGESAGFAQAVSAASIAALAALGAGGALYRLIMPDGWIGAVFGRSVAAGLAVLLALLMVGISMWLVRAWLPRAQRRRYSELTIFAFAGLGLVYAVDMLVKGGT
jgi:hypothetical protein